jgi:hypothetical protein
MLTTVIYGLLCGITFTPLVMVLGYALHSPVAFRLTIWVYLAGYLGFLIRWAGKDLRSILFPVLFLLFLAFWTGSTTAFLFMALGTLSWVRTGICSQGGLLKSLATEAVLSLGGGVLLAYLTPQATITWAMAVWIFFLLQSLYFLVFSGSCEAEEDEFELDSFEQAKMQAEKILSTAPR